MTEIVGMAGGWHSTKSETPEEVHDKHLKDVEEWNAAHPEHAVEPKPAPSLPPLYPSDFTENARYRVNMLMKIQTNEELKRRVHALAKRDILFWINTFVFTYNPRKTPSSMPFVTYKYEDELILDLVDRVKNQKDLLIDKSRDMGVTWCVLLVFTWFWQFGAEGFDFLVGSRKEQYIDVVGNMDTLIEKIRFILRNQPKWMLPRGFDWKTHSNYMKIINPETKNTIVGEATNNNFSRGGRRRAIFFDEFAFWDVDAAAWRASADSTNCRIVVSTPCGLNNHFAKLRFSNSIDVRTLHWKLHPEKDEKWYQAECIRRNNDPVEIAQELDINYEGSEGGILFSWGELKNATKNEPVVSSERKVVALDPSAEGDDEAVFYVSNNGNIVERKILNKTNAMELAGESVALIKKHKAQVFICDAIGNDVITSVSLLLGNNHNVKIIAFKGSEKAQDPVKYYNRRAEAYCHAAKQMKSGNIQVDDDHTLMVQLSATKYTQKDGRVILISKELIKESVGSSPDRADAWVLASEGLKYTYSVKEQVAVNPFRKRMYEEEVDSGAVYGDWGDSI